MSRRFDLIVIGGGLTGCALACAVGSAGFDVALVEGRSMETMTAAGFDGRVTAVALGSKKALGCFGVWEGLADKAQPITDISVEEAGAPSRVRYDHRWLGDEPLGWIVENRHLREALRSRLESLTSVRIIAPAQVAALEARGPRSIVQLGDGRSIEAPLTAVCEGRNSQTRTALGIEATRCRYWQTAIVCTLSHEKPHCGLAFERFFSDGPFARLPMTGRRSSIVWALDEALAGTVVDLDDEAFLGEVAQRFGDDLGELELTGPRWHYPLELVWAERYTAARAMLVGDAARAIHPIAGQGWNLAVRDVASVAEIAVDRLRIGLDPGDDEAVQRYEAWRRFDSLALVSITDSLNRLFANDIFPVRLIRTAGLAAVERLPPAKRFFMRHAMGLVGDLPRAMRGQDL